MPVDDCLTVETKRFGTIEVELEQVIHFPKGLLGFENRRRYVLIENDEHEPFVHLQSLDDPSLAFILVNPRWFFPHYKVQVERPEIAELAVTDLTRVATYVIVTVPDEMTTMSANLQGPLLVNRDTNVGKQVVLVRSPYTTRHYLMDEIKKTKTMRPARVREASSV
jgi:flagellar assembly factor FliW